MANSIARKGAGALKRNWGLVAALLAAAIVTPSLWFQLQPREPDLPAYEYVERHAYGYYPGGRSCQPEVLTTIRDGRKAAAERERCSEEAENHRLQSEDLIQQARAANAAEAEARTSYELAWMGLYGTIGGFLTLIAAGGAALYAREAARAANKSLAHNRVTSQAELRPWLELEVAAEIFALNEKQGSLEYRLKVTNIGKTPAIEVYREARLFSFGPQQEIDIPAFFEVEFKPWPGSRPRAILPQGTIDMDGHAQIPRGELKVAETESGKFVHPVLALRVVYRWDEYGIGQTCVARGVFRLRTESSTGWNSLEVYPRAESRVRASLGNVHFDNIC